MSKVFFFILLLFSFNGFAQISEQELISRCEEQFYKDYVSKYLLPNFGSDSSRIKVEYQAEEILKAGFKMHSFFRIRMNSPHSFSSTYCIRKNDGIILIDPDTHMLNELLNDCLFPLTILDKSMVIFIAVQIRPLKGILANMDSSLSDSSPFRKEIYQNCIRKVDINGRPFTKSYCIAAKRNTISFFVYDVNMNDACSKVSKYSYIYKNGQLKEIHVRRTGSVRYCTCASSKRVKG